MATYSIRNAQLLLLLLRPHRTRTGKHMRPAHGIVFAYGADHESVSINRYSLAEVAVIDRRARWIEALLAGPKSPGANENVCRTRVRSGGLVKRCTDN